MAALLLIEKDAMAWRVEMDTLCHRYTELEIQMIIILSGINNDYGIQQDQSIFDILINKNT